jgi:hypothetical protein
MSNNTPDVAAPAWRALVRWPDQEGETLRRTPVGRWNVLVGRWVVLDPAYEGASAVVARVLADLGPGPKEAVDLASRPRARVEVWSGGVSVGEHDVPSRVIVEYLKDTKALMLRLGATAAPQRQVAHAGAATPHPAGQRKLW